MSYGEKHIEIKRWSEGTDLEELFKSIVPQIPQKNGIMILHEALRRHADCDFEMVFLNEPGSIAVFTREMLGRELVVRCDKAYDHENVEENDMLMLMDDERIMLFDYGQYIESVTGLELSERQCRDILLFCMKHEVADTGNALNIKREIGEIMEN